MTELKRTPLYERHKSLGGKIVPFAGWEMPLEYSGILKEHEAVRTAVGIFDVSHMGEIEIRGKQALEFCQKVSTNDASALKPGKVQYSAILNAEGGIVDDCTLYRIGEEHFLFVVNASRKENVLRWFEGHPMEGAKVEDRSDDYGLLALQGKKSEDLLSRLVHRDLSTVGYYEFTWTELSGAAVMISRTGYTGEDGFEIYLPWEKTVEIWDLLMKEGSSVGITPIGLGARDTLRLEMGYSLYGNELNEHTTPLEAGLAWIVKMDKGTFFGRNRLVEQKEKGLTRRIRGIKMIDRGIPRPHYEIYSAGRKIGEVTSGTFSPTLKQGVGLAMLPAELKEGNELSVRIREKDNRAAITKPPFVAGSVKK
ncbi:MAG: glycine cleavage system aminomethyltransferase GcvT [Pseudomonadota bacterium]